MLLILPNPQHLMINTVRVRRVVLVLLFFVLEPVPRVAATAAGRGCVEAITTSPERVSSERVAARISTGRTSTSAATTGTGTRRRGAAATHAHAHAHASAGHLTV